MTEAPGIEIEKRPSFDEGVLKETTTVHVKNLTYKVKSNRAGEKTLNILSDLNMVLKPGHLMAIMGPSGCGKTTLLNLLADRVRPQKGSSISGEIRYNGLNANEFDVIANARYVMQNDTLLPFLTVYETLLFGANLKLKTLTAEQRKARVENVISSLGLQVCRDVLIGGELKKGISGGQKKRVSIGLELVDDPSLLFLDEPTSGLDASLAYDTLVTLVDLAKQGRTVVATVHQPRSQVFGLFDQLTLLNKGRCVFQGAAADVTDHFGPLGFPCPPEFNPADFILDLVVESKAESTGALVGNVAVKDASGSPAQKKTSFDIEEGLGEGGAQANAGAQVTVLEHRVAEAGQIVGDGQVVSSEQKNEGEGNGDAEGKGKVDAVSQGPEKSSLSRAVKAEITQLNLEAEDDPFGVDGGAPASLVPLPPPVEGATEGNPVEVAAVSDEERQTLVEEEGTLAQQHSSNSRVRVVEGRVVISADEVGQFPGKYEESKYAAKVREQIAECEQKFADKGLALAKAQSVMQRKSGGINPLSWWFRQMALLMKTNWTSDMRNPMKTYAGVGSSLFLGLMLGGIYYQLARDTRNDARNWAGALFVLVTNLVMSAFNVIPLFPPQRAVMNKDSANGLYGPFVFYVSKTMSEIPLNHLGPTIMAVIFYWMVGLQVDVVRFFLFLAISNAIIFTAQGFFQAVSAVSPTPEMANVIGPLFFVLFFLLSGFFVASDNIPDWIEWFRWFGFIRYGFIALFVNEIEGKDFTRYPAEDILKDYDVENESVWFNAMYCSCLGVLYRILAYCGLRFLHRRASEKAAEFALEGFLKKSGKKKKEETQTPAAAVAVEDEASPHAEDQFQDAKGEASSDSKSEAGTAYGYLADGDSDTENGDGEKGESSDDEDKKEAEGSGEETEARSSNTYKKVKMDISLCPLFSGEDEYEVFEPEWTDFAEEELIQNPARFFSREQWAHRYRFTVLKAVGTSKAFKQAVQRHALARRSPRKILHALKEEFLSNLLTRQMMIDDRIRTFPYDITKKDKDEYKGKKAEEKKDKAARRFQKGKEQKGGNKQSEQKSRDQRPDTRTVCQTCGQKYLGECWGKNVTCKACGEKGHFASAPICEKNGGKKDEKAASSSENWGGSGTT
uniref:ABC transporter domain-containing protein n=1 Tax=Chromera velia CCMP2878 TaxID=1169474 RepID=A0A0G4H9Y0_9ALVE|eukprot:Cvel_6043.t1-p1 / transcript=Cvel_6043.t1 / gene=Cvel_6043 / organism=Chromera_velia_CCMP2878 / gene_product=ABC transporter G family member 22, putative / transcript_product=ABC transporter G family member 22, putative / location=Cvel_scaffold290:46002-61906(-) / protein_length=1127 / sequence_SO=supercontig / SO=protein_coding / is_pseudo=false